MLAQPTTVLFGAGLPEVFFDSIVEDLPTCDLIIVAGTSLVVSPGDDTAAHVREVFAASFTPSHH